MRGPPPKPIYAQVAMRDAGVVRAAVKPDGKNWKNDAWDILWTELIEHTGYLREASPYSACMVGHLLILARDYLQQFPDKVKVHELRTLIFREAQNFRVRLALMGHECLDAGERQKLTDIVAAYTQCLAGLIQRCG